MSVGSRIGIFSRSIQAALVAATLFALTACNQNVDLDSIKKLAAATAVSADSYSALAQDFYISCTRRYGWEWASALSYANFGTLESTCAPDRDAATQWQDANLVVLSYVHALGALAGGGDTQTDYGIPSLLSTIKGATKSNLTQKQQTDISTFANALITDIVNIRRRDAIATYAPQADKDLDSLIGVLEDVANDNYSGQLSLESTELDHFFQLDNVLGIAGPKVSTSQLALRDRYREARDELNSHSDGIAPYVRSLEGIKSAHSALVASIQSNSVGDVSKIVQSYVSQLTPDIQQINRSVKGGKP